MEKVKIKVVTYNLQTGAANERFLRRFSLSMHRFIDEKPDIIGFQEVMPDQQELLIKWLPDYEIIGFGRDKNFGGESNCVAFRKDTFTLYGFHQCWLSPTPYVPGTRFEEQSSCPRVVVDLLLKHKDRDLPFRYLNTHLDHVGEGARVLGMGQILDRINKDNDEWNLPTILTGDMNAKPTAPAIINAINNEKYPLNDTTANLDYTYNFRNVKMKIDYIFATKDIEYGESYKWDDRIGDDMMPTDHYPVACDLIV